jgi:hypothetical protein
MSGLLLLVCRSNVEKTFHIEEVYDGDISVVQIATCKANSERVIIKTFKRDKLVNRMDLQNKVGTGALSTSWHKQQQMVHRRHSFSSCAGSRWC